MSAEDAAFALVKEMQNHTAELVKAPETVEKLTRALEALPKPLNDIVLSLNFQRANTLPVAGANLPRQPVIPGVEVKMEWKPFKDKAGHWTFSKSNPLLRDTLLAAPNKTLEHGGFKYRLSGEQDMFIQRFPAGGGKA